MADPEKNQHLRELMASNQVEPLCEARRLLEQQLQQSPEDRWVRRQLRRVQTRLALFLAVQDQRELVTQFLCRLSLPDATLFPLLSKLRDSSEPGDLRRALGELRREFEQCLRQAWGMSQRDSLPVAAEGRLRDHPDLLRLLVGPSHPVRADAGDRENVVRLLFLVNEITFGTHKDKHHGAYRVGEALAHLLDVPPRRPGDHNDPGSPGIGVPRTPKPPTRSGSARKSPPSP